MKAILVLALLASVAIAVQAQTCGGDCFGSTSCAASSGDTHCRCINLKCAKIEGECGGGCISDGQCATWSHDDPTCTCNNLVCGHSGAPAPAYNKVNHFMAVIKHNPVLRAKFIEENDYSKVAHLDK